MAFLTMTLQVVTRLRHQPMIERRIVFLAIIPQPKIPNGDWSSFN
jgi:hypothetical protein